MKIMIAWRRNYSTRCAGPWLEVSQFADY